MLPEMNPRRINSILLSLRPAAGLGPGQWRRESILSRVHRKKGLPVLHTAGPDSR